MQSSYSLIKNGFAKSGEKKVITTEYVSKAQIAAIEEAKKRQLEEELLNESKKANSSQIDPEELLKRYEEIGQRIIQDAENEKKALLLRIQMEASNAEKNAYEKGYEQGMKNGEAFKISKGEESIILRSNSFHIDELKKNCERWKLSYAIKNEIFVISDDSMEPGNAILEKPSGIVKVGVDVGMEQVKKAILA